MATRSTQGPSPSSPDAGGAGSAHQRARTGLARALIVTNPGDRLANIAQLREGIGVGTGTIQKALTDMQSAGYVRLDSRQRLGTFVIERDLGRLWDDARLPQLTVLLPLPNSWEFQGLATALRSEFDHLGVPASFLYGHGSAQRFDALAEKRAQIVVTSAFAAMRSTRVDDLTIAVDLGADTYYARDSIIVLARTPPDELPTTLRVGMDPLSNDHSFLTEREFPDAERVRVSYAHIPGALTSGTIDAAVWHRTALGLSLGDQGLTSWNLRRSLEGADEALTRATLVIARDSPYTAALLASAVVDRIRERQRSVVDGDVLPLY